MNLRQQIEGIAKYYRDRGDACAITPESLLSDWTAPETRRKAEDLIKLLYLTEYESIRNLLKREFEIPPLLPDLLNDVPVENVNQPLTDKFNMALFVAEVAAEDRPVPIAHRIPSIAWEVIENLHGDLMSLGLKEVIDPVLYVATKRMHELIRLCKAPPASEVEMEKFTNALARERDQQNRELRMQGLTTKVYNGNSVGMIEREERGEDPEGPLEQKTFEGGQEVPSRDDKGPGPSGEEGPPPDFWEAGLPEPIPEQKPLRETATEEQKKESAKWAEDEGCPF